MVVGIVYHAAGTRRRRVGDDRRRGHRVRRTRALATARWRRPHRPGARDVDRAARDGGAALNQVSAALSAMEPGERARPHPRRAPPSPRCRPLPNPVRSPRRRLPNPVRSPRRRLPNPVRSPRRPPSPRGPSPPPRNPRRRSRPNRRRRPFPRAIPRARPMPGWTHPKPWSPRSSSSSSSGSHPSPSAGGGRRAAGAPADERRPVHARGPSRRRRIHARSWRQLASRATGHRRRALPDGALSPARGPERPRCGRDRSRRCSRSTDRRWGWRSGRSRSSPRDRRARHGDRTADPPCDGRHRRARHKDAADLTVANLARRVGDRRPAPWTFETTVGAEVPQASIVDRHRIASGRLRGAADRRGRRAPGPTHAHSLPRGHRPDRRGRDSCRVLHDPARSRRTRRRAAGSRKPVVAGAVRPVGAGRRRPARSTRGAPVPRPRRRMSAVGCSVSAVRRCRRRRRVDAHDIAVVCGVYPRPAWRLVDAEEEAARSSTSCTARRRRTRVGDLVIDCLKGHPPADVLHFAVHGTYAPEGVLEGLDPHRRRTLDPMVVKGCAFAARAVRVPERVPGRQRQRGARRLRRHGRGVLARRRGGGGRAAVVDRRRRRQGARAALLQAASSTTARPPAAVVARRTQRVRRSRQATARRHASRTSTSDIPGSSVHAATRARSTLMTAQPQRRGIASRSEPRRPRPLPRLGRRARGVPERCATTCRRSRRPPASRRRCSSTSRRRRSRSRRRSRRPPVRSPPVTSSCSPYSGHGGQVPDKNGDETEDGYDETWVLYDRQLVDDELYALWSKFPAGVRVVVLSDSCHSGSAIRETLDAITPDVLGDLPSIAEAERHADDAESAAARGVQGEPGALRRDPERPMPPATRSRSRRTCCSLSGCQDNQTSADGKRNGLFTQTLLEVWDAGNTRAATSGSTTRSSTRCRPGRARTG